MLLMLIRGGWHIGVVVVVVVVVCRGGHGRCCRSNSGEVGGELFFLTYCQEWRRRGRREHGAWHSIELSLFSACVSVLFCLLRGGLKSAHATQKRKTENRNKKEQETLKKQRALQDDKKKI